MAAVRGEGKGSRAAEADLAQAFPRCWPGQLGQRFKGLQGVHSAGVCGLKGLPLSQAGVPNHLLPPKK